MPSTCSPLVPCVFLALALLTLAFHGKVYAQPEEGAQDEDAPLVEVFFVGEDVFDERELRRASPIALARLEESGTAADMFDVAVDIEAYYHDRGFPFATVVPRREVMRETNAVAPRVHIVFEIEEGPRIEVVEVRFDGHSGVFDVDELRAFFVPLRIGIFGTGPRWYSQRKIDAAARDIESLYAVNGFLEVQVDEPTLAEGAEPIDEERYRLIVRIVEGPQYFLRSVTVAGEEVTEADHAAIRRKLSERLHERLEESRWLEDAPPYTPSLQVTLSSTVSSYYKNRGHFAVEVEESLELDAEAGSASVRYTVTPGPRYLIGTVEFENLEGFREGFLRSIIPMKGQRDQPYSLELEQESFQRLMQTGLIQQLNVVTEERVVDGTHYVDYRFELQEAPSIELGVNVGYGSYELLRGSVDLAERNILGTGRTIGVRALASFRMREVVPRFTDPWTLGGAWPYTVSGFYRWRQEPGFTVESFGATVTLSHRLAANWRFAIAYQIERATVFDIEPGIDPADVDARVLLGTLQPRIVFDTRDSFFDPQDGFVFSISFGLHTPFLGGDVSFLQTNVRIAGFISLVPDAVVLALRYTTGFNLNWRNERIPLQERFFNGGSETVRSFRQDRLLRPDETGPRSAGGLVRNIATVELRHKIFGPLWGGAFIDAGNLVGEAREWFEPESIRFAIGYGLRFLTPIGPLRLDFAWNPDRRDDVDEDEFVLHFSVGYSF